MKRLIILICTVSSMMIAQEDAAGFYKLTGLDVQYYSAARYDTPILVTDIYGAGITIPISLIPAGAIFYPYRNGPLTESMLAAIGVNLNVLLNDDGTGALAEGSFYPDVNVDPEICVSDLQVLPITDVLLYESNANLNLDKYGVNVAGLPNSATTNQGLIDQMGPAAQYHGIGGYGGLGLSQSVTFDYFPMIPDQPTICDGAGNCFGLLYPDGSYLPAGAPVPGVQVGYWKKGSIHGEFAASFLTSSYNIPNTVPDFYLEWHAIDGHASQSGLGDIIGEDEDGDGTDFDRIFGLPYISAAYITPDCFVLPGLSYPIFGGQSIVDAIHDLVEGGCIATVAEQFPAACAAYGVEGAINALCLGLGADAATCAYIAANFAAASGGDCDIALAMATASGEGTLCYTAADIAEGTCVSEADGTANDGYVMDASLSLWGNMLTYNAASYQQCVPGAMAAGMDYASALAYCGGLYGDNDSGADFNPYCLADGDDSDCGGRLVMHYSPTCIPQIEMREVDAEFIEVGEEACGGGDVNADGTWNVLDIVSLATCVLAQNCTNCAGDVNSDGAYNVLDIVSLATCILAQSCGDDLGRVGNATPGGATSAEFNVTGNEVTMAANGSVGGIQMTLSHGKDFSLTLTDGGQFSDYLTEGNTTRLVIIEPTDNNLFTASDDFTIESVIATADGQSYMQTSISTPTAYSIGSAYPNPFNPTTHMTLDLNTDANISVKVFNTLGQLVDVIAEGQMVRGSYSFTWDGSYAASGVYLIQTEIGSDVHSQKIMLIK